jgi:hypothetical protein
MLGLAPSGLQIHGRAALGKNSVVDRLKTVLGYLALSAAIGVCAWFLPFGSPKLHLKFYSGADGVTQLYFNPAGEGYSEENSLRQIVRAGNNEIQYDLTDPGPLRWDPLESDADVRLTEAQVSVFGLPVSSEMLPVGPINDVQKLTLDDGGLNIRMRKGAGDPQVSIALQSAHIVSARVGVSAAVGLLIAAWVVFMLRCFGPEGSLVVATRHYLFGDSRRFHLNDFDFRAWGLLFAIAAFANLYFLATYSLSFDDDIAALRTDPSVWVTQGRFTVYLVEKFLFPQSAIPYAPYVLFAACMATAYMLILRVHRFSLGWRAYLGFPVFCAFPTWWFISEFYSNVPAVGIGLLLTCLALYLAVDSGEPARLAPASRKWNRLLAVLLLALAIGAYQSFALMFICMAAGAALAQLVRGGGRARLAPGAILRGLCGTWLLALLGIALYAGINILAQKLSAQSSGYIDGFIDIQPLLHTPWDRISGVLREMAVIYSGQASRFGGSMPLALVFFAWAAVAVMFRTKRQFAWALLLLCVVWLAPFLLHFATGPIPLRILLAVAYVAWLMVMLALLITPGRALLVLAALIVVYQIQLISVTSQYQAAAEITQSHDRLLAADLYRRMGESSKAFDREAPIVLDVYGYKNVVTPYSTAWSSLAQASFFGWGGGFLDRMATYMNVLGYRNVRPATDAERRQFAPLFDDMSAWPAAHSVKKVGNAYLVRFSFAPDPFHEKLAAPK